MNFIPTHIDNIRAGDIILHDNKEQTVCHKHIKRNSFMGITIFGDSYHLGTKPVMKKLIDTPKIPLTPSAIFRHQRCNDPLGKQVTEHFYPEGQK